MKTVFELSKKGRKSWQIPTCDVPEYEFKSKFLTETEPELPEVDETTLVRHYMEPALASANCR